jgi:peptidoglycan/LPS O-acetylase OafA/YrhL
MSQRIQSTKNKKRPWLTYAWIFGLAALVFVLIYKEWTEYLYVLATLGVTALLIIVATADLGVGDASTGSALPDAQGASSGVSSSVRKTSRK